MSTTALAELAGSPRLADNLEKAMNAIEEAAQNGADIVLFPEIHLSPFFPVQRGAEAPISFSSPRPT